jgi:hypothetical protein
MISNDKSMNYNIDIISICMRDSYERNMFFKYIVKRRNICIDYLSVKMTSNDKNVNNKVVDLDEIYNSHIKFISISVYKVMIFENGLSKRRLGVLSTVAGLLVHSRPGAKLDLN